MRGTIALVVIAVLGFFGFQWGVNGKNPAQVFSGATEMAADAADSAMETAGDVAEGAADMASDAADTVDDTAEGAVDAATDAVTDVAEGATEMAEGAVEAVTDTAEGAGDIATEATETTPQAADVATEEVTEAVEAGENAQEAINEVAEASDGMDIMSLLTPETFDAALVSEWIDGQDFGPLVLTPLKAAVDAAGNNPDLISGVIEQIKSVMGN
jgi:hypothetical protein